MRSHVLWYPYAQMKTAREPLEVARGEGACLHLADGRRLVDAIASWWCVIHGYNHPELNAALEGQLHRMAHVMLGGLTHEPARALAERLVALAPPGLAHVFFGDSGSVGVEIALKMAVQYWRNLGRPGKVRFLALRGAYHGDTWACMSVCDPADGMHTRFSGILPPNLFLDAPRGGHDAPPEIVEEDAQKLETLLARHHGELACLIVEPLLQAAGGFHMHSPLWLRRARELCDRHEVLLIFDEVATGFGRTGTLFAAERAGVSPDILVLGKALTAGYLGHSATLASTRVFESFLGDDAENAFLHGPTFMGNPLACAVSLKSIEIFQRDRYLDRIARIEAILRERLLPLRSPRIREVRVLGACGVIEVHDPNDLAGVQDFAVERGVWLRPFGRWLYTMPPYIIGEDELGQVTQVMCDWFARP